MNPAKINQQYPDRATFIGDKATDVIYKTYMNICRATGYCYLSGINYNFVRIPHVVAINNRLISCFWQGICNFPKAFFRAIEESIIDD